MHLHACASHAPIAPADAQPDPLRLVCWLASSPCSVSHELLLLAQPVFRLKRRFVYRRKCGRLFCPAVGCWCQHFVAEPSGMPTVAIAMVIMTRLALSMAQALDDIDDLLCWVSGELCVLVCSMTLRSRAPSMTC